MKKKKAGSEGSICGFFLVFVLFILMFMQQKCSVYASEEIKNVLYISSYSESFPTVPEQLKGIQS